MDIALETNKNHKAVYFVLYDTNPAMERPIARQQALCITRC